MQTVFPSSPAQRLIAALGALLAVLAVVAIPISGGESSGSGGAGSGASGNAVDIKDFNFVPATLTVKAGTKVTWTNSDSAAHTATADVDGGFDTDKLEKGAKGSVTFKKPGNYAYHCDFHAYMKGTVVVE